MTAYGSGHDPDCPKRHLQTAEFACTCKKDQVAVVVKDEREFHIPIPCDPESVRKLGLFLQESGAHDYSLVGARTIERGQRDRILEGLRITVRREERRQ